MHISDRKAKRTLNKYIYILVVPLLTAIVGSLLLLITAQIPNDLLWENTFNSGRDLAAEYSEIIMYGGEFSLAGKKKFLHDNCTDALIIEESYTLGENTEEIFLKRTIDGNHNGYGLVDYLHGQIGIGDSYSRYWMGFRATVRPLLLLGHYYDIRAWAGILVSFLLISAAALIGKKNKVHAALAMAVSFGLVEPYAVCSSLQFSCCFILAFLFSCIVCARKVELGDRACCILFSLFGALTQFFDFYTYPLITCVTPILLLVCCYSGDDVLKKALKTAFFWLASWIVMWIINLIFVQIFTDDTAFLSALASVNSRFGIGEVRASAPETYDVISALRNVWYYRTDLPIKTALPAGVLLVIVAFALSVWRNGISWRLVTYLVLAAMPVMWIIATANPINIHYYFQYRVLYPAYFSLLLFFAEAVKSIFGCPAKAAGTVTNISQP